MKALGFFFGCVLMLASCLEAKGPPPPPELLYKRGMQAFECKDWLKASRRFGAAVKVSDPKSHLHKEAAYYRGLALFELEEYEEANEAFSIYLQQSHNAENFMTAIEYKFSIAEAIREGMPIRLIGSRYLPRWGKGDYLAITIYDEIILAIPSHELAISSLYGKGEVLVRNCEFDEAINTYMLLQRRFPKHPLARKTHYAIISAYLAQTAAESYNADTLELARVALQRYKQQFPRDEHILQAEEDIRKMEELFAVRLCERGEFYERIGAFRAAALYYTVAAKQFPDTQTALNCFEKLVKFGLAKKVSRHNDIITVTGL